MVFLSIQSRKCRGVLLRSWFCKSSFGERMNLNTFSEELFNHQNFVTFAMLWRISKPLVLWQLLHLTQILKLSNQRSQHLVRFLWIFHATSGLQDSSCLEWHSSVCIKPSSWVAFILRRGASSDAIETWIRSTWQSCSACMMSDVTPIVSCYWEFTVSGNADGIQNLHTRKTETIKLKKKENVKEDLAVVVWDSELLHRKENGAVTKVLTRTSFEKQLPWLTKWKWDSWEWTFLKSVWILECKSFYNFHINLYF